MKKLCILLLAIVLIAGLAACGGGDDAPTEVELPPAAQEPAEDAVQPLPPPPQPVEPEAPQQDEDVPQQPQQDDSITQEAFVGEFDWSIDVAPGWTKVDIPGLNVFASPFGSGSHFNVHVDSAQGKTLDEFVDFTLNIMEDVFADFYLHVNEHMDINGKDARLLVFETTTIPVVYLSYQFFIVAGDTVFIIAYSRMPGTDYFDDILYMLDTFTIFSRE